MIKSTTQDGMAWMHRRDMKMNDSEFMEGKQGGKTGTPEEARR